MFVAPSQLKKIGERFPDWKFQVAVNRSENRDVLIVRVDATEKKRGKESLASFENHFAEICTVRIDRVEVVPAGSLAEGYKLIVDERKWK
jgi:phenylacetate-coenzyme A ligase PaaK-like adenylate-forming protein